MFSINSFTLEDPAHPLLGPTLSGLRYLVSCPSNNRKLRIIHNNSIRIVTVTTTVTVYSIAPLLFHFISLKTRNTTNFEENLYPEIGSTWVPFDKTKGYKYWIVTFCNIFISLYAASTLGMYDSNVVALMTFFFGQLIILKLNCERLFEEATTSHQEIIKKLRKYHHHHVLLVRNFKLLDSLLSPVMFVYVIVCSVMMCSSAVQLNIEATIMEKAWIAEFLVAQIFQLFLFCWHSQKVLDMSLKVNEGVYSSAWWSQDVRINRLVILLGGQLNKSFVFTAGPLVDLDVATFIAILKGTYIYYALLINVGE